MLRQSAHKISLMPVVCTAYSDICLSATPYDVKRIYLHEAVTPRRRKAQHYLSECYYLAHFFFVYIDIEFIQQIAIQRNPWQS